MLELKAWDEYARRRGYKYGVSEAVHGYNVTRSDQVSPRALVLPSPHRPKAVPQGFLVGT